ncbi:MAG: hypothetical protein QNJ62_14565 [Methyloceanibacter sp.]|nr:hypothetical protein [Methyloceanibacter sp.]
MISLTRDENLSKVVHVAGFLLMLAAIIFIGFRVQESFRVLAADFARPRFVVTIIGAVFAYSAACGLVGAAWVLLLSGAGDKLGMRNGLIIFGRTQILKYLPSNVLHFAGRYGMARAAGATHAALIFSTGAEIAIMVMAASTIAILLVMPLFLQYVVGAFGTSYAPIAILVALGMLLAGSLWWLRREGMLTRRLGVMTLAAYCLYLCFFLINGMLLWLVLTAVDDGAWGNPFAVLGVGAAAWIGGFVVPGAPAGLGIREVIVTSGLEVAGYGTSALAAALGFRIVTLGGDIIVALVAFALRRP